MLCEESDPGVVWGGACGGNSEIERKKTDNTRLTVDFMGAVDAYDDTYDAQAKAEGGMECLMTM